MNVDDLHDLEQTYVAGRPARPGHPWVLANMVSGLDGSAAIGGRVGELSGPVDHRLLVFLRSLADVVVVGASTVRAEGYGRVRLTAEQRDLRRAEGRSETPPLAVISRSLAFDWDLPVFASEDGSRPIILTAAAAGDAALDVAGRHAEVVVAGDAEVDLALALTMLGERCGPVVLTEGGPTVLGELLARGLLDELCLTLSPVLGGDPLPIVVWPDAPRREIDLELVTLREVGGHLFLRYLVGRP